MALAPDPHQIYIGKQFLELGKEVDDMNQYED